MRKLVEKWMVYPVLALGCLLGTVACGDDDEPATEPVAKVEFKLNAESVTLLAEGGNSSVTYTLENAGANSSVRATSDREWVRNLKTGTANKITFDVAANTETEAREAKVTVTYSDDVNEDVKTSFVVKQAAGDPDFVITLGETGSSWIQLGMVPKDANMRYMLGALPVEDMDGYISDEAFFDNEMSGYQELADMAEMTLDQVLDILFMKGSVSNGTITLLEPETEYYVYCYGIASDNELATPVIKQKVTTPAAGRVSNTITIDVTEETVRSVTADITATTPDSYVLVYAATKDISGLTDDQLTEELLNKNYALEAGNNKDALFNNLSPNTEYTILAMGRAGGVATTGVVKATCKTKEAQQSDITYSLPDKKYFDALEVQKQHPELFTGMTVTAEDVIIAANIKADGASSIYTAMFTQASIDAEEARLGRKLTDEEYLNLALNQGDDGNLILAIVSYDLPLVLVGVAMDADGNPGTVYKENITVTKSSVSPAAEFDAYLTAKRMSGFALSSVADSSSMKSLLQKKHTDGSGLKSFAAKPVRSRLKK